MQQLKSRYFEPLFEDLAGSGVESSLDENLATFRHLNGEVSFFIADENFDFEQHASDRVIHLDQVVREPLKIAAIILSRLKLNKTVFARNCEAVRISKKEAEDFLDEYHLMGATSSSVNIGLMHHSELLALASFSTGRKMRRLPENSRSFEMIRFCTKKGVTVTGGLTKILKAFCELKSPGDVMTYVSRQFSDGRAFAAAGFMRDTVTAPHYFLVERISFARFPLKEGAYDAEKFYVTRDLGNIRMIYKP
jgi:hypothetical protein